jgi:hypothetical protein
MFVSGKPLFVPGKPLFVPGKPFQVNIMFVGKDRNLTKSIAPKSYFTREGFWPCPQTLDLWPVLQNITEL